MHLPTSHPDIAILPLPVTITRGEGSFLLTPDTVIVADEQARPLASVLVGMLAPALGFTLHIQAEAPADRSVISLNLDTQLARLGQEGYTLRVTPEQVTLSSASPHGLFYAIQTLRQLLPEAIFSTTSVERDWRVPAVTIEDFPRYSWRGLMLDTSRHFTPKQSILKMIDLLALHKMNVLHLHLTDDQGWRIEIKKYPRLTEIGSRRKETVVGHAFNSEGYDGVPHGGFYTQDDLREIVAYAAARFITVVPEIEVPGHAQAAIAAYPEFGVLDKPVEVATIWGIHPYLYAPTQESVQFLQDVLTEVMEIFPSPYIHVGGDEAIKDQWRASAQVQARIKELGLQNEEELQSWYIRQMDTFLSQHGRRLVGWDEILEGGLAPGAIVMSWRGYDGGIQAAQAGHDVIMCPVSHVYFDYYQSNNPAEPLAIGNYTPLDKVYSFEPVPPQLTAEEGQHVLGAQGTLWSEYIPTPEHLEYMAFPRAVALAEAIWTPQERRDFADFRQRLARHESRLTRLAVNFWPVAKLEQEQQFPPRKR